jgi:DNA-binding response OmpR family regulator
MDNPPENVKSILVGESDPEILRMLEVYLNSMGYDYVSVSSGDKVLDHVFNNNSVKKEKYDIVLLDTHLKKMSGLTVANEIRKRNLHQRIIIMSTTPKEQLPYELIKSARIHDNDVFTKPFRLAELLCSIER